MGKPNVVGAAVVFIVGIGALAYLPGLCETAASRMSGETKNSVIQRYGRLRELDPTTYKMTKPGMDLGLKIFYKE